MTLQDNRLYRQYPDFAREVDRLIESAKAHSIHAEEVAKQHAEAIAFFRAREVDEEMPAISEVNLIGIFKLLEGK